jgi:small ubiquitin-related modifier
MEAPGDKAEEKPKQLSLKVVSQDGNEVYFKIKGTTPMRKLIETYCSRQAVSVSAIRFLYDGQRVQPDATPNSLDMEEDDIIDAVLQQTGGGKDQ